MELPEIQFTPEWVDQVNNLIRAEIAREKNVLKADTVTPSGVNRRLCVLKEDLDKASSITLAQNELPSAEAEWIVHDNPTPNSPRSQTDYLPVTVFNPSEDTSFKAGKLGYVEQIGGIPCFIPLYQGGSAGAIAFGTILEADCSYKTLTVDVEHINLNEGEDIPDAVIDNEVEVTDHYWNLLKYVVKNGEEDQIVGKKAEIKWMRPVGSDAFQWHLTMISGVDVCGEEEDE